MASGGPPRQRPFSALASDGLAAADPLHNPEGPLSAGRVDPVRWVLLRDFVFQRRGSQRLSTALQGLGSVAVRQEPVVADPNEAEGSTF